MDSAPALSTNAALVVGLAGTALPFAESRTDEAERWLRVLRLHGDVSGALQALGVGEAPIEASDVDAEPQAGRPAHLGRRKRDEHEHEVVRSVTERATRLAEEHQAETVGTVEVLLAAMDFYGQDFDRALRAHGTDREEVLERVLSRK